ncbi:hypothetical protein [Bacillus phage vB_BtM_BMBsp2]|nr:hypothetical protein [Bacillus phage vB_BtM_BMBsp2]
MKINEEVYGNGNVEYTSEDGMFSATIEYSTGEILELNYDDTTIHKLYSFISKVKSAYNRLNVKESLNEFVVGGE